MFSAAKYDRGFAINPLVFMKNIGIVRFEELAGDIKLDDLEFK